MSDRELLTTAQVLSLLQIGRTKLWGLVRRGDLPAYRIGSGRTAPLRFRRAEVLRWLDDNRVPQRSGSPVGDRADTARE
ncbi:MAG TPA: helix-turn-helix domain-containing protein [Myxococcota bacterium]|nr:helix-turn-helix domain-containing protein [Myxococcota bacterium]